MKRHLLTAIGGVFTVVCLYFAFRGIHLADVARILGGVQYGWAIPILGATVLSIWLRAWRWKVMLEPVKKVSLGQAYSATMIGYMANNVLPMRLGEVVRAYALGRNAGVSKSAAFATIVVERAFDLMALLLLMAILLFRYSFDRRFQFLGYIALIACVGLFAVMGFVYWKRDVASRLIGWMLRALPPRLRESGGVIFGRFLDGFEVLSRGHHLFWTAVLSFLVWLAMALSFHFTNITFGLDLPLDSSLVMVVICALGVMLPSGPGFVGTFEVAAKYGLLLFKDASGDSMVSESVAVSYALFYHAVQFIPLTLLGFYHLWREKMSLARAVDSEPEPPVR